MSPLPPRGRRRGAALVLTLGVAMVHVWLAAEVAHSRIGAGAADSRPQRIEVAFVRELAPARPAPVAPRPAPRRARVAMPAAESASAPASAPELQAQAAPALPLELPALAAMEAASEAAPTILGEPLPSYLDPTTAVAAPAFDWPPSTRLSYRLTGNYRGPVEGSARVEWLRQGSQYQVHLDVVIGPALAPLITRQMSSSGELTAAGLSPRRYDESTRVIWRDARAQTIHFEPQRIRLPSGREVPALDGVQDSVSQFVQLTWRFTLDPSLLQAGRVLEVPLALPRRVETWVYDVRAAETLWTPAGAVEAVRVQPRREARAGGDLVAETWYAPTLQYLPVRIVIRQDAQTYVDLMIERLPEQAAAPPAAAPEVGTAPAQTPKRAP